MADEARRQVLLDIAPKLSEEIVQRIVDMAKMTPTPSGLVVQGEIMR